MAAALVLLWGCEAAAGETCPPSDAGTDAPAVDAPTCEARVFVGPVIIAPIISGIAAGSPCTFYESVAFRVRVFAVGGSLFPSPHGLVADLSASCGSATDYLDLGPLPPGEYEIALESEAASVNGGHVVVGGDLIGPLPCGGAGGREYFCFPLRATVRPCALTVVPAAVSCDDPSNEICVTKL